MQSKQKDFSELAEEFSLGPEGTRGGDLGYFEAGQMPEEFDNVFKLKINGVCDIIRTPYGFHLFKVVDKIKERKMSFDESEKSVEQFLLQELQESAFQKWLVQLKEKSTKAGFILSLLLPLVFGLLSAHARVLDKVVAKVNSELITLSAIEERADLLGQKYVGAPVSISEQDLLKEALNMIIEEKLQIQEGKKFGFVIDEDVVDAAVEEIKKKNNLADGQLLEMLKREGRTLKSYKNHIRDQIMVSKITRFEIGNRVNVIEKGIIKYYKENQKEFWQEGKVKARHILFIAERGSSEKIRREKLQQAKKILLKLRKGNDFAKLAMKYSEDISASNGGDVGFVGRGKMVPEFEEAVFNLKPGQVSDIVKTEYGYHYN